MCGILGEIGQLLISELTFYDLLNMSRNRGPDQSELWTDEKFCRLGFNRLSILDLSERGKQPLISPSGRFVLLFNGEIYNYKALQQEFGISDSALRSQTDSEVIAHLADQLSIIELSKKLNGMFAIAIYDRMESTLTLIRDFAGIKPLFYGINEGTFVFASQFDQIFQHPKFRKQLNVDQDGLYNYVSLGYMAPPRTVFRGIFQCLPGQWIKIDSNLAITKGQFRAWKVVDGAANIAEQGEYASKLLDSTLSQVVKDQLVADVPIGVFLSGGIDSPLIAAYASKHKPDITAYTVSVQNKTMDESKQASIYAQALGLKHKVIPFSVDDLLKEMDRHFEAIPEPFGDYSSLPTHLVTQFARQENKVMLSGDGGDELFWGYPRFLNTVNHSHWFRYPKSLRRIGSSLLRRSGSYISYAVSSKEAVEEWILEQQCHNSPSELDRLLPYLNFSREVESLYSPKFKIQTKVKLLQYLRWNEFYGHMQRVLAKVDRCSMGNSLEVRVPLLDHRIIDFAWALNPSLGIKHQEPKYLLKKLLQEKLKLTPINRQKAGFSVPIRDWLQGPLRKDLTMHFLDIPMFGDIYWNKSEVEAQLHRFLNLNQGNEWGIWIIYSMQKWAACNNLI